MHILVNVSSIDPDSSHDGTCVLAPGDHDFITTPSYVTYQFAIQRHKNFIDRQVKLQVYTPRKEASNELTSRICEGIKKSKFTPRAIKDAYDATVRAVARRAEQAKK